MREREREKEGERERVSEKPGNEVGLRVTKVNRLEGIGCLIFFSSSQ